jgi:hypothetical protein
MSCGKEGHGRKLRLLRPPHFSTWLNEFDKTIKKEEEMSMKPREVGGGIPHSFDELMFEPSGVLSTMEGVIEQKKIEERTYTIPTFLCFGRELVAT